MKGICTIIFSTFVITGFPSTGNAQNFSVDSSQKSMDVSGSFNGAEVHLPAVKINPRFPGGVKAWHDFLRSNFDISVPFLNKVRPGIYKVMVRYIVGSDGKLHGIGADSNSGYGMESEILRCIRLSPDWIPAETSSGKKVSFTLRTIVTLNIKQNDIVLSFQ